MPWEKNFDLDEATDKAIKIFLTKGYEATSMSDLTEGMDINRGSLYNAFGSKRELFQKALQRYDRENRERPLEHLSNGLDGREIIVTFFDRLVEEAACDNTNLGCLVVNTMIELHLHDEDVREVVMTSINGLKSFLYEAVIKGQETGSIPTHLGAEQVSEFLLSSVLGLRVLSRGKCNKASLQAIRDQAVQMIS